MLDKDYDYLIDVREQDEWDAGHIEGAIHIPLSQIESGVSNLNIDREAKIMLYCARGGRSTAGKAILKTAGYKNVFSLDGGFFEYNQSR